MVRAFQKLWIISNYFPPHPDMVESCQVGAGLPCFFVVKLQDDSQASSGRDALATLDHSDIRGIGYRLTWLRHGAASL